MEESEAMQAKMQAKDETQAVTIGTVGETEMAKTKTGTGMVRHQNGNARTDRMKGTHKYRKARAAQRAAARAAYIVLTKPMTLTGGRSQTDHSPVHNQKTKFTSACRVRAKFRVHDVRYIRM